MRRKTLRLPEETIEEIESRVEAGEFRDFSDAVRKTLFEEFEHPTPDTVRSTRSLHTDDLPPEARPLLAGEGSA